jgi:hypothetical protein
MAQKTATVNVRIDDKQLKEIADELKERFEERIKVLEGRIRKVRELAEVASKPCAYDQTGVCTHEDGALDPVAILAVLDGEDEKATGGVLKAGDEASRDS